MFPVLVLVGVLAAVALVVAVLSALAPTRVTNTESIDIDAPTSHVYDDIRLQDRLMRWSVWPRETRSQCAVDPGRSGADGTEGARTVFLSKGKPVGHQEITRLVDQREVDMRLEGPGPPHEPSMRFELEPLGPESTRVTFTSTTASPGRSMPSGTSPGCPRAPVACT